MKNVFAPIASRLIRCLLVNPKREWSVLELSKDAEGKKEEGSEERVYEVNSYRGSYKLKKAKRQ